MRRRIRDSAGFGLFAGACLALLCSCSGLGGPEYQQPDTVAKAEWSEQAAGLLTAGRIDPAWWNGFQDPYLSELVRKAIAGNLDIRVLAARSNVAKAAIGQARAGLLPTLTAGAGTDSFKQTGGSTSTKYSVAAEADWEIDIWGKVRKGVEAQQAEFKATEADWRAGYLALVADVAAAYFQIRQFDEQMAFQERTIARSRKILGIFESLYGEGLVPKTQLLQQRAEISSLQNDLLELQRLRRITENGLATLLGMPADSLRVPPARQRDAILPVAVPAGLPSELLTRRPDIIAAEYRVLQAYNLQGQAHLARLPSLSLTGRGGSASFALSDLLRTGTFGLSSLLAFPIFDPSVTANIEVSKAQTLLAEEDYRRTVITAFEEVENALTNLASHKLQSVELARRRVDLATVSAQVYAQLQEGMVSQLEVFEVERTLLDAEQSLLANHWQTLTDTLALYKALGGGWPRENVDVSSD